MMPDKTFVVFLAVGSILLIGCVLSQQHELYPSRFIGDAIISNASVGTGPTMDQSTEEEFKIDRYTVYQYPKSAEDGIEAAIYCYSNGELVASIDFIKEDSVHQDSITGSGTWDVYYPYSRYNDVLDMFEKGNVIFKRDPAYPSRASLRRTTP
jgi:hypothetical protein